MSPFNRQLRSCTREPGVGWVCNPCTFLLVYDVIQWIAYSTLHKVYFDTQQRGLSFNPKAHL